MAERIQRKRTKGWRMPDGAVYVGRPTRWGNPYPVARVPGRELFAREDSVRLFRDDLLTGEAWFGDHRLRQVTVTPAEVREHLAGRDLACWCPLDQPCHADVLLDIANDQT